MAPRAETCSELPGGKWGHLTFLPWKCVKFRLSFWALREEIRLYIFKIPEDIGEELWPSGASARTAGHTQDLCNRVSVRLA